MLPKAHRVPAVDIPVVMKRGVRLVAQGCTLVYRKTSGESRFAFIVSTKVDKKATTRNRIRRILSESVRLEMHALPFSLDGVFVASKELIGLSQKEAQERVKDIFAALK